MQKKWARCMGTIALGWMLMHLATVEWTNVGPYAQAQWGFPVPWVRASNSTSGAWDVSIFGLVLSGGLAVLVAGPIRRVLWRTPLVDVILVVGALSIFLVRWFMFAESHVMPLYGDWGIGSPGGVCLGPTCL